MIDAYEVAEETGMGERINTIMQTCFFAISGVLPADEAIAQIKKSIKKTYGKRGEAVVQRTTKQWIARLAEPARSEVPARSHQLTLTAAHRVPPKPLHLSATYSA